MVANIDGSFFADSATVILTLLSRKTLPWNQHARMKLNACSRSMTHEIVKTGSE